MTPKRLTQTVTATPENGWSGNCWQYCLAMLLGVQPEALPDQAQYDLRDPAPDGSPGKWRDQGRSYHNAVVAYLRHHHGLGYIEIREPDEVLARLHVAEPGWHMLTGRTVRSDANGGMRHVVVARYGELWWDPHPSHAGLTDELRWAFLVPYPKLWAASDTRPGWVPPQCECPACGR